ncbi:unnamed protein product, partial [Chrysoparadoxa australica]
MRRSELPVFRETQVATGAKRDPQFGSMLLLPYGREGAEGGDVEKGQGATPMLEVQVREARSGGKVIAMINIPLLPLWLGLGHMTRTWYPLKERGGKKEAGK